MHAEVLLIDEQAGRQEAVRRGLRVAGTLSVLDEADQAGLVSFDQAVTQLRKTSFRVSQAVISEIMQKRPRCISRRARRSRSGRARQFRPGSYSTTENQFPRVPGRHLRDHAKATSLTQLSSRNPRIHTAEI